MGAITALAFVLPLGEAQRFASGKQVASYLGLIPAEYSSGERERLGHITSPITGVLLRGYKSLCSDQLIAPADTEKT